MESRQRLEGTFRRNDEQGLNYWGHSIGRSFIF